MAQFAAQQPGPDGDERPSAPGHQDNLILDCPLREVVVPEAIWGARKCVRVRNVQDGAVLHTAPELLAHHGQQTDVLGAVRWRWQQLTLEDGEEWVKGEDDEAHVEPARYAEAIEVPFSAGDIESIGQQR